MDLWQTARVQECAKDSVSRFVFGYGSMIWRPPEGAKIARQFPAKIRGFSRRFWMQSCDHRGTPERPGRVVTLIKCPPTQQAGEENGSHQDEDSVAGVVFELENFEHIIGDLDYRERHGYTRTIADVESLDGAVNEECHVYYYDVANAEKTTEEGAFQPTSSQPTTALMYGEFTDETAKVIAASVGPSGPNSEYLYKLCDGIESMCGSLEKSDPYLHNLRRRVREIESGIKDSS